MNQKSMYRTQNDRTVRTARARGPGAGASQRGTLVLRAARSGHPSGLGRLG